MTNEPGDDDDRTVYQPKTGTPSPTSNPAQQDDSDPAPADDPGHEATRFEKPVPPPDGAHEPTRFETSSPRAAAPASSAPLPPAGRRRQFEDGEVLNGIYRIERFLARGGMGEVYEAINIHQQQERVAIKVMLPHLAQDELVAAMFSQEAEMLTRLHHEAIVPYRMAARDAHGNPYIVTEFIDGPSLEQKLGSLQLSEQAFAYLAQKLAAGLGTAHNLGAIHRDIAPDNILLAGGDPARPKIIDFGIAKDARENSGTIVGEGFAGKLKYVAPEQLGEYGRNVGPWTDLYSLALTLRAVAVGHHSDMGGSLADAVRKRQEVPDLTAVPARFRPAFEMALQPDPAQRPQSMAEFILRMGEPFGEGTGLSIGQGAGQGVGQAVGQVTPASSLSLAKEPIKAAPDAAKSKGKPKRDDASIPGRTESSASTALAGLAGNRLALIGGGIAALLLVVVVAVVVLTSGGAPGKPKGEASEQAVASDGTGSAAGSGSGSAMAFDTPEFEALAKRAVAGADCAWLTYDGASSGLARFVGGAANPGAAQSKLVDALKKGEAGSPSIDMGDVVRFKPESCAAINAMLSVRSSTPLISSPQTDYEAELQPVTRSDGEIVAPEGMYAKVEIRIDNIKPNDEITLISMDANGVFELTADSREIVRRYVDLMKGTMSDESVAVTIFYPFNGGGRESNALFIVTGESAIPRNLFGKSPGNGTGWADSFRAAAKQNGWKVDAVWFSVENKVR